MDNFKIIYRILKSIERGMDYQEFDDRLIRHEALGVSEERWVKIMAMLSERGYVKGVIVIQCDGAPLPIIVLENPTITLEGLEYLQENSLMKKAAALAKGVIGAIT